MFSRQSASTRRTMTDQVISPGMAQSVQQATARARTECAWIISEGLPDYPGEFVARFATAFPTDYVMTADTLAELQAMLPAGLSRSDRRPSDPPDVVEIWFSAPA